jgi:hypothetical protein
VSQLPYVVAQLRASVEAQLQYAVTMKLADLQRYYGLRLAMLDVVEAAHRVDEIYEGLRTDANDGEFALWSEGDLLKALHALRPPLARFDFKPVDT